MRNALTKIALTAMGLLIWLTLPAAAQGNCFPGPGPNGQPLSYRQWYAVCGQQVVQMCQYMGTITSVPAANCNNILAASYNQYKASVITVGGQPPCSQYSVGAQTCLSGYMATCNGYLWQRSANRC